MVSEVGCARPRVCAEADSPLWWWMGSSCSVAMCMDPLVSSDKDTNPVGSGPHPYGLIKP